MDWVIFWIFLTDLRRKPIIFKLGILLGFSEDHGYNKNNKDLTPWFSPQLNIEACPQLAFNPILNPESSIN